MIEKNYGQNMGQMYQKGQRTLGKAKGAKKMQANRLSVSFSKIPLIQTDMMMWCNILYYDLKI